MTRLAWFHCFSGIAGDMALGSLVDAGADLDEVRMVLDRLPVAGLGGRGRAVLRCGIAATKVHVHAEETTVVRTAAHIAALVEEARLPDRVRRRALSVFGALAEAEGRLHRRPPEQVHFHEVGGLDAIVDIVGTCAALEVLDVDDVARQRRRHGHRDGAGRPRAAPQPGARRSSSCWPRGAPPPMASISASSSPRPPAPRCSPPSPPGSGRCRR